MKKTLALASPLVVLLMISGPAFAATNNSDALFGTDTISSSGQQAVDVSNPIVSSVTTDTDLTNAHRYRGGPKSND